MAVQKRVDQCRNEPVDDDTLETVEVSRPCRQEELGLVAPKAPGRGGIGGRPPEFGSHVTLLRAICAPTTIWRVG